VILPFSSLPADATSIAGGKGASLGRMRAAGFPVPPGFVVCAAAFGAFLDEHNAADMVRGLVAGLDVNDDCALDQVSRQVQAAILSNPIPQKVRAAIEEAYLDLGSNAAVAVRSSAVGEDGETASFAGQQETYLNVRGTSAVMRYVRECWASFFAPRALFYRGTNGALRETRMAVVVQEMVGAEKSGVMFTVHPVEKRRDRVVIEAVFGLGEGIVSGLITPDHYVLDRDSGQVLQEFISVQTDAVVQDGDGGGTRQIELSREEGSARVLNADELECLRRMGLRLEEFFGKPQDVEWSIRGGELFLLQSRPITTGLGMVKGVA
jgi:pyruvate, water dikinase